MTAHHALLALTFAAAFASSAMALVTVKDPAGTTVLTYENDTVKDAAGNTRCVISDSWINDAAGNHLFFMPGDIVLNKPDGDPLMYIDGRNIRPKPGSDAKLLYVDGKDLLRGDRSGKPLYKFDDVLAGKELIAVIYALKPELFGQSASAAAATAAAQSKSAASDDANTTKDFFPASFSIDSYMSTGTDPTQSGTVTITKAGDVLVLDFQLKTGTPLQGVGLQQGSDVWVALGPPSTVGLAVYKISGGSLAGTWYNATGKPESFGSENATGPSPLTAGDYKIIDAKAPFTQTPYTGTLTLESADKKFEGTLPIFLTAWDLGGYKAKGVGFATPDSLVVAMSTSPDQSSIVHFKMNIKDGYLNGQFFTPNKTAGLWNLKKK